MRSLPPFLLSLAFLSTAHAQPFPVPITAERAVSDVVWTGAAGNQSNPRVATNGDVALVGWEDSREGGEAIYVARVDGGGNVLDPLGVRIADGFALSAVAWNGESFVVVMGATLTFITPDMTITAMKRIDLPAAYAFAAATSGPDVRFLFVESALTTGNAAVVDGRGEVIARKASWTNPVGWFNGTSVAGASDGGFLVLHELRGSVPAQARHIVSERIDRDGNPLSSADSGLPFDVIETTEGIAGGSDGFLLVRQKWLTPEVIVYRLDEAGVFTGRSHVLANANPTDRHLNYRPAVAREENRYVVVWHTSIANGLSYESVADIGLDDSVSVRQMYKWTGITSGIALASNRGRRFVATSVNRLGFASDADVFARVLLEPLQPADPHLVTASGSLQTNVHIAWGANGYAVTWGEDGPDGFTHAYVRRFSPAGLPQDAAPIPLFAAAHSFEVMYWARAKIVSNGSTYLLGWQTSAGFAIRRLAAETGRWIDAQPIPLGIDGVVDLASNGTDAVAVSVVSCGTPGDRCLASRRIALTGEPLTSPVMSVKSVPFAADAVVESNGSDYLAAWTDPSICFTLCAQAPSQVYAMRLRADGTAIDPQPLLLDNGRRFPSRPSIAWSEGRYFVAWADSPAVRGTRVAAEGAVVDRDAEDGGVLLESGTGYGGLAVIVAGLEDRFVLLIRRAVSDPALPVRPVTWQGVAFGAGADLGIVAAMPRTLLLSKANDRHSTLDAAGRGNIFAIAYDRLGDTAAGGVPRAFLRLFVPPVPRRPAAGR